MINNTQTVLNRTNQISDSNLGQIRVLDTDSGITICHHVTASERFYSEYSNFAVKTAQSTVEMCRVVFEAKNSLSNSDYTKFLSDIGHKGETSTIRKYLAIGEQYDRLIQYANLLPNSWTSIYTLTQLSPETFDALTSTDTDMSKLSGKDIKALVDIDNSKSNTSTSSSITSSASDSTTSESSASESCNHSPVASDSIATSSISIEDNNTCNTNLNDLSKEDAQSSTHCTPMSIHNNAIDIVSKDDTYQVLVCFNSKPSDDSWWDLTEAIEAVVDDKNLDVDITQTRPLFEVPL